MVVGLWRERACAGEVQSEHGVTKSMRGRYLQVREVTSELRVASASSSKAWARKSYGGGGSWLRAEDGRGGGARLRVL
jgi:hypothetical protein